MEKNIKHFIECTQDLQAMYLSTRRYLQNNILNVIEALQDGVGYISFNDESGFPEYYNNSTTEYERIFAIRVADGHQEVEIMTDANYNGDIENDTWVKVYVYQSTIDLCEIFNYICEQFNIE